MRKAWPIVPALLLLLPTAVATEEPAIKEHTRDEAANADQHLMKKFSVAFKAIEESLSRGQPDKASTHAESLFAAATVALQSRSEIDPRSGSWRAELQVIANLAQDLTLRSNADPGGTIQKIRTSCVSCHVRIRSNNEKIGLFPAEENTIYGKVEILTYDGQRRSDHSDVVVFLDGVPGKFDPSRQRPSVSQKERRFLPSVLPILKGTTVEFPNDDTVFHNVFSLSKARPFDLNIYEPGKTRSVTFSKSGVVRVFCNIHPQMSCSIIVLNNPYFTTTDKDGFFLLTEVPDGRYTMRTWNERGATSRQEITVSKSTLTRLDLQTREKTRTIKHKNKFGKPYPGKYR